MLILAPCGRTDGEVDAALPVDVVRGWLPQSRGTPGRILRGLIGGLSMTRLLLTRRIRFLLCGQLLSLGVPTRLLSRLCRIPYAVFVHGADLTDYQDRALWGSLTRWVIGGADSVIVNSRFTAGLVERLLTGLTRRIVVLPMGVDPAPVVAETDVDRLRMRYGIGSGPVILSVSRLVRIKGHDVVIRSMPRLLERCPGLKYVIVGSGPESVRLERLARSQGVEPQVVFAGAVDASDLPAHYRLATLFVQLSRVEGPHDGVEGFGLSFLEAASYGVPSIAGMSGGVPEAVLDGKSGILVTPTDQARFIEASGRLLADDRERSRMSEDARSWAAEHTWERSAHVLMSLTGFHGGSETSRAGNVEIKALSSGNSRAAR